LNGHLLEHIVQFGRELRGHGVNVTPGQVKVLAEALEQVPIADPVLFFYAARTTLVTKYDDLGRFEHVFDAYWRKLGMGGFPSDLLSHTAIPSKHPPKLRPAEVGHQGSSQRQSSAEQPPVPMAERAMTYSAVSVSKQRRFDQMTPEELEAAQRLMQRFELRIPLRSTRRKQPGKGSFFDFRRSFRQSLKNQGEFVRLEFKRPKQKPRALVVLADVSGSMERYSRMLLHFLHAVYHNGEGFKRLESFAFGTHLTSITRALKRRSVDQALQEVGKTVTDWSGGTRIGSSLHSFNHHWAKRVLGQGSVVLLISDGWDQGEPEALRFEMERLQKSCHRLIWLNPLLGTEGFQPLTRGLQAALPYVDDFLPVHNLASLEELGKALETLPDKPSPRRSGYAR
jgi:hypothetical protein